MRPEDKSVSEKTLWSWLSGAFAQNDDDHGLGYSETLHMERIENAVGVGNPDVTGCFKGGAFDIELKTAHRPARATTAVIALPYIRPAQKNWHVARWKAGGQCYFLIQVGLSDRYLIPGVHARDIEGKNEKWLSDYSILLASRETPIMVVRRAASYRNGTILRSPS
jgi:penicillin-binding protein-related factor A (putative recombinase)